MNLTPKLAAIVFLVLMLGVSLFQLGLAFGMPWGHLAMGGIYPGAYPPEMRIVAFVQIALYGCLAITVCVRAGLFFPKALGIARLAIWVVVALSVASLVLNLITPSPLERLIWAPVALVMVMTSLRVALGRTQ